MLVNICYALLLTLGTLTAKAGMVQSNDSSASTASDSEVRGPVGLGVSFKVDDADTDKTAISYAVIESVFPGSSAANAGIQVGDEIRKVRYLETKGWSSAQYGLYLYAHDGDELPISVFRDGKMIDLVVTAGPLPQWRPASAEILQLSKSFVDACTDGNCINGIGAGRYFTSEFEYTGQWRKGLPHGEGEVRTVAGAKPSFVGIGQFLYGLYHGAIQFQADNAMYRLNYYAGKQISVGEMSLPDGQRHLGGFRATPKQIAEPYGYGRRYCVDGRVVEGEFRGDRLRVAQCITGNCRTGQGVIIDDSLTQYSGGFKDGLYSGNGSKELCNGDVWSGVFNGTDLVGIGTFSSSRQKMTYEGNFRSGQFHGQGVMTFLEGPIREYSGNWHYNAANGNGRIVYRDGSQYRGQVQDMERHGKGSYTPNDGSVQSGMWKHGRLLSTVEPVAEQASKESETPTSKSGELTPLEKYQAYKRGLDPAKYAADKRRMEALTAPKSKKRSMPKGCQSAECMNGQAVYKIVDSNGTHWYRGEVRNGEANGRGVLESPTHRYAGEYKNDLRHGHGTLTVSSGAGNYMTEYSGQWYKNQKHGSGTIQFKDGSRYDGDFIQDQITGKGRFRVGGSSKEIIGYFRNGEPTNADVYIDGRRTGSYGRSPLLSKIQQDKAASQPNFNRGGRVKIEAIPGTGHIVNTGDRLIWTNKTRYGISND